MPPRKRIQPVKAVEIALIAREIANFLFTGKDGKVVQQIQIDDKTTLEYQFTRDYLSGVIYKRFKSNGYITPTEDKCY